MCFLTYLALHGGADQKNKEMSLHWDSQERLPSVADVSHSFEVSWLANSSTPLP